MLWLSVAVEKDEVSVAIDGSSTLNALGTLTITFLNESLFDETEQQWPSGLVYISLYNSLII